MMFLRNWKYLVDDDVDTRAKHYYEQIRTGEPQDDGSWLTVTLSIVLKHNAGKLMERLAWPIADNQLPNVLMLIDHYLGEYPTLHYGSDDGNAISCGVIDSNSIACVGVIAVREPRNDEDERRTKFTPEPTDA